MSICTVAHLHFVLDILLGTLSNRQCLLKNAHCPLNFPDPTQAHPEMLKCVKCFRSGSRECQARRKQRRATWRVKIKNSSPKSDFPLDFLWSSNWSPAIILLWGIKTWDHDPTISTFESRSSEERQVLSFDLMVDFMSNWKSNDSSNVKLSLQISALKSKSNWRFNFSMVRLFTRISSQPSAAEKPSKAIKSYHKLLIAPHGYLMLSLKALLPNPHRRPQLPFSVSTLD